MKTTGDYFVILREERPKDLKILHYLSEWRNAFVYRIHDELL